MKKYVKLAAAAVISAGALAIFATSASAAIVCNRNDVCWHVRDRYNYKPEFGVVVHPDNWRAEPTARVTWREHTGRGYWRNGVWIKF